MTAEMEAIYTEYVQVAQRLGKDPRAIMELRRLALKLAQLQNMTTSTAK
jgi:hypothetical protein